MNEKMLNDLRDAIVPLLTEHKILIEKLIPMKAAGFDTNKLTKRIQ